MKKKLAYQIWLAGSVFLCCLTATTLSRAQTTPDGSLSTDVKTTDNLTFTITGGNRAGGNLFHSFREFSVPTGGAAIFDNAIDVKNIISRVTGGSISNIDGLIQANGSANLFLLNPNGIIFGSNAQLNIGSSFIASTANQLNFADRTSFSATDPQAQPLLTISVPIGLQFRNTPGNIINQSVAEDSFGFPVGLQVKPGKSLVLVGGGVFLDGGSSLFAPGGRIEIGSITGNSFVSLTPIAEGWTLEYEGVQNFQDIQLSQEAVIDTSGESSGNILLRGRQIAITNTSTVASFNYGTAPGKNIELKASELVEVSSLSSVNTNNFSTGAPGDIIIETRQLIVRDRSFIDTSNRGDGRGGNLTVKASDSVEIDGSGGLSGLRTQTLGSGNAGDLKVTTGRLILRDGGQIDSSTSADGNGGTVNLDASEAVEVSGRGIIETGEVVTSGLFAKTEQEIATGNGGSLSINTGRLVVADGGSISVAAVEGSQGQAGTLSINASRSVEVNGTGSSLLATSESRKPAGDVTVGTGQLIIRNGGELSVSGTGEGAAGNLQVQARSVQLNNQGAISARSLAGNGGDITLQAQDLLLMHSSNISTTAGTEQTSGTGGNITIDTDNLVALENSDIDANAFGGRGGQVRINASGVFGTQSREQQTPESDITASSNLGPQFSGIVELNTPEVNPTQGLVELPAELVDAANSFATGCAAGGENKFIITGRGGLPPDPRQVLSSNAVRVEWVELDAATENRARDVDRGARQRESSPTAVDDLVDVSRPLNEIVEAQGWIVNGNGSVSLVATAPTAMPHSSWQTPVECPSITAQ